MRPPETQSLKRSIIVGESSPLGSVTGPVPASRSVDREIGRPVLDDRQPAPGVRLADGAAAIGNAAPIGDPRPGLDRAPGGRRRRTHAHLAVVIAAVTVAIGVAVVNLGPDEDGVAAGLGDDVDRVVAGAPDGSVLSSESAAGDPLSVQGLAVKPTDGQPSTVDSTADDGGPSSSTSQARSTSASVTAGSSATEPSGPSSSRSGLGPTSSAGREGGSAPTPGPGNTVGPADDTVTTRRTATTATTGRRTSRPPTTSRSRTTTRPTTGRTAPSTSTPSTTPASRTPSTRTPTTGTSTTRKPTTRPPTTPTPTTRTPPTTPKPTTPAPTTPTPTTPAPTTTRPPTTPTTGGGGSPGRVIWEENFNSLNTATWKLEHSTYGDGNNELQCYRPENVSVANGKLILRAATERYTCPNGSTRQVTSGMVRSRGVTFSPGQAIEFRVKLNPADPNDQSGLWPAVWASGWAGGGWPAAGEMDWLEVMTAENPRRAMFSMHYADPSGNHALQNKGVIGSQNFSAAWHVIRFDYGRNGRLTWYLDGVEALSVDNASTRQGYPAPFDQTVSEIKINLALGGRPGPLSPGAVGSRGASFEMDYIRILEL